MLTWHTIQLTRKKHTNTCINSNPCYIFLVCYEICQYCKRAAQINRTKKRRTMKFFKNMYTVVLFVTDVYLRMYICMWYVRIIHVVVLYDNVGLNFPPLFVITYTLND